MQFRSIFTTAILGVTALVQAEFVLHATTTNIKIDKTFNNPEQATKFIGDVSKVLASKVSTYESHLTADPAYSSMKSLFSSAISTVSGLDPIITATDRTTTFKTLPTWYSGLPSDVQKFYTSVLSAEASLVAESVEEGVANPALGGNAKNVLGVAAVAAVGVALGAGVVLF